MRNLGNAVRVMSLLAGLSTLAATLTVACSGDDNGTGDAGPDSGLDAKADVNTPDVQGDVVNDVVTKPDADAGESVATFQTDVTNAFCARFQTCCNSLDAGTFDMQHCQTAGQFGAWNGSNGLLAAPGVLARGNVTINSTAATSCLAGIATLSCPNITSSETKTATDNCYAAMSGKLATAEKCVNSVECPSSDYCMFGGDAGTTDGGVPLGVCAALAGDGGACGAAPYGDPNFLSGECAHEGWHSPPQFCDYDNYPSGGYTCAPLRIDGAQCYFDNECASGICGSLGQDCVNTACTCVTSRDYTQFCQDFAIKDAGAD